MNGQPLNIPANVAAGQQVDLSVSLIAPVVYAMRFSLTVKMVAEAMLPYPTMTEAVRSAARQF